jgi:hypothetical protein
MKTRHLLLLIAFVGVAWFAFFSDKPEDSGIAAAVVKHSPVATTAEPNKVQVIRSSLLAETAAHLPGAENKVQILVLQPRAGLISATGDKTEHGLFSGKVWAQPPPPKSDIPEPIAVPTAPPLPFTYLGKKNSNGKTEVYLAGGDEVLVVHENDLIRKNYRVKAINPPTLLLVYLPLNQIQQLSIGATN